MAVQYSPDSGLALSETEHNQPASQETNSLTTQWFPNSSQETLYHANTVNQRSQPGEPHGIELGAMPSQQAQTSTLMTPSTQTASAQVAPEVQPPVHQSQAITGQQKDRQPWKYRGYPAFCKWMAADQDFYVVRQFSEASVRVALFMQDHIAGLEEELAQEDFRCRESPDELAHSGTFRFDHRPKRREILEQLAARITAYHKFIINQRELNRGPNATETQIRNVKRWLKGAQRPIQSEEANFIEKKKDLIPVLAQDRTPLRRFLDRFDFIKLICIKQKKTNRETFEPDDFEMQTTVITKHSHLDKFVFCTIIVLGLAMLIGPLWWLNKMAIQGPNLAPRLAVITGFLITFVILLSLLTIARPFEVLAATAAYGAVLMVFMQLGHTNV